MKTIILLLSTVLVLGGCATGDALILDSSAVSEEPRPVEEVQMLLKEPNRPFKVIALVSASGYVEDYWSASAAQKAVLEELRKQAADIGADAVIIGGKDVINEGGFGVTNTYGSATGYGYGGTSSAYGTSSGFSSLFSSNQMNFSGQAIAFTD